MVVQITLRPILPFDLMCIRQGANGFFTPGAEGLGIVHDVRISILLPSFHAHRFGSLFAPSDIYVLSFSFFVNLVGRGGSEDSEKGAKSGAIYRS